jgi:hypothetical protein
MFRHPQELRDESRLQKLIGKQPEVRLLLGHLKAFLPGCGSFLNQVRSKVDSHLLFAFFATKYIKICLINFEFCPDFHFKNKNEL